MNMHLKSPGGSSTAERDGECGGQAEGGPHQDAAGHRTGQEGERQRIFAYFCLFSSCFDAFEAFPMAFLLFFESTSRPGHGRFDRPGTVLSRHHLRPLKRPTVTRIQAEMASLMPFTGVSQPLAQALSCQKLQRLVEQEIWSHGKLLRERWG